MGGPGFDSWMGWELWNYNIIIRTERTEPVPQEHQTQDLLAVVTVLSI